MDTLSSLFQTGFSYIGPFFVLLGLLIFVHELGHFLVAKFYKVRVETFSLGFGKKILSYKRGDTTYCISLIPLGGYVKMYGDDPSMDVPEENKHHSFLHKPVGQRIAIVLAGPLMNLFFAAFIFAAVAMIGENKASPIVGDLKTESAAYTSGFRAGDKILSINEKPILSWDQIKKFIQTKPAEALQFSVERNGVTETIFAKPTYGENDNILEAKGQVGVIEGLSPYSRQPVVAVDIQRGLFAGQTLPSNLVIIEAVDGKDISFMRDLESSLLSLDGAPAKIKYRNFLDEKAESQTFDSQATVAGAKKLDSFGLERTDLHLYQVKKGSPAEKAGFKSGDKILSINQSLITQWEQLVETIKSYTEDKGALSIVVDRAGEELTLSVQPEMTELTKSSGAKDNRFTIGIVPAIASAAGPPVLIKESNLLKATVHGWNQAWVWTKMVAFSFVRMIQSEVSSRNIGGILTIGKFAGQSYQVGLSPYLKLMAIISINLFLLNLLPVPVLDGGHLVFFTIEAIRGAPVSLRKMEMAQQVGLIILMSLMVFAFYNDIANIINPPF